MAKTPKMKDGIKKRYDNSWSIVVELAPVIDAQTGKAKRRQKWVTVRGSYEDAVKKRNELRSALDTNTYVDTSELTFGEWLKKWWAVEQTRKIKPLRPSTISRYENVMELRLYPSQLAKTRLQDVTSIDIEGYFNTQKVSGATMTLDHAILHRSFRKAVKNKLLVTNPVADVEDRPRATKSDAAETHAWSGEEAARFLAAAKKRGTQTHAFYALALESGMRKSELGGLRWANVDLDGGKIRVIEQLTKLGKKPEWGPTKSGKTRTIDLSDEMVTLLRDHRRLQAELKMRNRDGGYHDFNLVFAKEWTDVQQRTQMLGHPLQLNNIGQGEYEQVIKAAKVPRIKFHGLRHTCATLLLQAGEPVHVVSERLGHASVMMTWQVYAHVLKDSGVKAARTMGALLHG